jgi:thiosulfate reductase cytochrome b subunit
MKRTYLHSLPLRMWHWANALMVIVLIITGIQIRIPGMASLPPQDPALWIHRYAGWAMAILWAFWLVYSLAAKNLSRHYAIRRRDFGGIFRQGKYYLISIFRGEENPFHPTPDEKFNPLQKMAYGSIMGFFAPLLVITGLLFSDILFLRKYVLLWDIAGLANALHVAVGYVFVLYLIIHLYMATLGPTVFSHIKAMITGYEEEAGDKKKIASQEVLVPEASSDAGSRDA